MSQAPPPCDLLIHAGLLLTLDDQGTVIADAAIAVTDGLIVAAGPHADLVAQYAPARLLGSGRHIAMPGLVNTHNHTPLMLVRGMVEDQGFAPAYLPNVPQGDALSDEEAYLLGRLGAWEMLRLGSTTAVDFYCRPHALARVSQEVGLRSFVGSRIMDVNFERLGHGERRHDPARAAAMLEEAALFVEAWKGRDALVTPVLGPHAADTCSMSLLRDVARLAEETGLIVHTHLHQSPGEVSAVLARDGRRPVEVMEEVGLLNSKLVAGHCIWVDDTDIGRIGRSGVAVAHAPLGNAAHGSIAPAVALEAAGARLTLCTDTKSGDMFQAMRMALAAARIRGAGFELDSERVLRWATRDGAVALGMPDLGAIVPGWRADLVLLDADAPNLRPLLDGPGLVVHSAVGNNVDAVVVNGRVVVEDGRPTLFDADEVVASAQAVAERLWQRAGRMPAIARHA